MSRPPRAPGREDLGRKQFGEQGRLGPRQRNQAADLVGQLPDVAGPPVQQEVLERLVGECEVPLLLLVTVALQEVVNQRRDLLASLAEGGTRRRMTLRR